MLSIGSLITSTMQLDITQAKNAATESSACNQVQSCSLQTTFTNHTDAYDADCILNARQDGAVNRIIIDYRL